MKQFFVGGILGVLTLYALGSTYILFNGGVYNVRRR